MDTKSYPRKYKNTSFTDRPHWDILTTTVYSLSTASSSATPWPYAAVDAVNSPLLHPLTLKPHPNLPADLNLHNFKTTAVGSFHHTDFPFVKLVKKDNGLLVLYGTGKLLGRLPCNNQWVRLSQDEFDDIIVFMDKIHVLDGIALLSIVDFNNNNWSLGKMVVSLPVISRWRKRLIVDGTHLYLVVRTSKWSFSVYKLVRLNKSSEYWCLVSGFDGGKVLFVSKDCCFLITGFGGQEYRNCIVYSDAGFPSYDDWRKLSQLDDEIWVFRMSDRSYGKVGRKGFPEIDWSPPSWMFNGGSYLSSYSHNHSEGEGDKEDGRVQLDLKESNNQVKDDDKEKLILDSNSRDKEQEERVDSKIQSDANIEGDADASLLKDVPPSLLADMSAVEEEVTRTLLCISGGNEAIENEFSRRNVTLSAPRACTSSANKRRKIDTATAKFEGFEIRSDSVPILQKIWRNHGNITENSAIRNYDITARALESLAIVVQILENTSVQSLSDCQADYLSSTLSDLKFMSFKVHWLSSFVEKAVKLHKSKAFVECLNKLDQLSSQVTERRAILLDEVAKLNEEENKLKKEKATVSTLIPFSEQVKYDKPLGAGLT